eukprot:gnl/Trimastix_PCT/1687.p1 GENE.gnl/Trimastix_PCT/1687~~gnl/Trimastix_PCT/1687.p1  ORF type:complete len:817 (-),score=273.82 gnl/Trimastix_PCT/1687:231-2681(-)
MKFGKQLAYLAVPKWSRFYIDYTGLKKEIKVIYRQFFPDQNRRTSPETELRTLTLVPFMEGPPSPSGISASPSGGSPLLGKQHSPVRVEMEEEAPSPTVATTPVPHPSPAPSEASPDSMESPLEAMPILSEEVQEALTRFQEFVERELHKVTNFLTGEGIRSLNASLGEVNATIDGNSSLSQGTVVEIKKQLLDLMVEKEEMGNFARLNQEGFRKILKKFRRRVLSPAGCAAQHDRMWSDVTTRFETQTPDLAAFAKRVVDTYVDAFLHVAEPEELATPEKLQHRRVKLATELEESTHAQLAWKHNTILETWQSYQDRARVDQGRMGGESHHTTTQIPVKKIPLLIAIVLIVIGIAVPWPADLVRPMRCLFLILFATIMWAFEAMALYITAMWIPPLVVFMQVLGEEKTTYGGVPFTAAEAASKVISAMMSGVIFLVLGGFSIGAALRHHQLDQLIASVIMKRGAKTPRRFLATLMVLGAFLSMWVSNVVAPVICVSVALPVLRELDSKSSYARGILMGIAIACNIGGMLTPLSSPQNAVCLDVITKSATSADMQVTFIQFLVSALPMCIGLLIAGFILVCKLYPVDIDAIPKLPERKLRFTWQQFVIIVFTIIIVVLWFIVPYVKAFLGSEAIIGMIPLAFFFGFNFVPRAEIKNLPWGIVLLIMGGNALGEAVKSSNLLHMFSSFLSGVMQGWPMWCVLAIFVLVITVVATFISHTVCALILLPVVAQTILSSSTPGSMPLIVVGSALACSGPMLLPASSFPNVCTISVEDEESRSYLTTLDFLKAGALPTLLPIAGIVSVYFGMGMLLIGQGS